MSLNCRFEEAWLPNIGWRLQMTLLDSDNEDNNALIWLTPEEAYSFAELIQAEAAKLLLSNVERAEEKKSRGG